MFPVLWISFIACGQSMTGCSREEFMATVYNNDKTAIEIVTNEQHDWCSTTGLFFVESYLQKLGLFIPEPIRKIHPDWPSPVSYDKESVVCGVIYTRQGETFN